MPEGQRPEPRGVAKREHALRAHHDGGERALQPRDDVGDRLRHAVRLVPGDQRGDDLGVRGGAEAHAALAQLGVQLDGVDQVPVVRQRDVVALRAVDRLGVLPR